MRDSFGQRSLDLGLPEREAMKAWWFGEPDILAQEGYDFADRAGDGLDDGACRATTVIESFDLQTQSLEAVLDVANQVLSLLQALLGSVGGLALLVAALGVANTMMMAIYERTREIGVLKALGASPGEIRRLFTTEAALIGLIGGIVGLLLGALLGRGVDWMAHRYLINEGRDRHRRAVRRAAVAGPRRDRLRRADRPDGRLVSRRARGQAGPGGGAAA